jgi:acetylornithine deacetylase
VCSPLIFRPSIGTCANTPLRCSHSGYPHLGKSATSTLLAVLNDLSAASWPTSPLLGSSTFNIGTLSGGQKHNIVFEYPEALLDWEIDGFEAVPVAFGTDVPRLRKEMCGKRVLFGPGSILVAHGPEEYIEVGELVRSIEGYKKLVMHFLE